MLTVSHFTMQISKLTLILLLGTSPLAAQNIRLSQGEMYDDFDELVAFLNDFAVHKDLNAIRLGIDYEKEFRLLRSEITADLEPCEFKRILDRTTRLIQDLHCSSMSYDYMSQYGKYQKKLNFKSTEKTFEKLKSFETLCGEPIIDLTLPILHVNGEYLVYTDFEYKGDTVKKGSVVKKYNGVEITTFIQDNPDKVWPIKLDATARQYNERFYQFNSSIFYLTFSREDTIKEIQFNLNDSISYLIKPEREVYYYSQKEGQVFVSKEHRFLYIGLPFMDQDISKEIIEKIDRSTAEWRDFEKVIIDIRGNPGGSDLAWREVLQHIIPSPISFDINLKYLYNERTIDYYGSGKDTRKENIQLLNDAPFWSEEKVTITLKPDRNSLNFSGKIYVLQDPYIYSSAGNLSNLCLTNDQLISVGSMTDLVGGLQKEPLFYQLKHSGLIYRVEPVLDFSNVDQVSDFAHNEVEVYIPETVEDRLIKTTYIGSIYGEHFLMNFDQLMQFVMKQ